MGFGDMAATVIMFIAILIVTAGVTILMTKNISEVTNSATVAQSFAANKMKTEVVVDLVFYNTSNNKVITYAKNVGQTPLDINRMTIYVNNNFFRINSTNCSARIEPDTDIINPGTFDYNEVLLIVTNITLGAGQEHKVKLITQYDTSTTQVFTT